MSFLGTFMALKADRATRTDFSNTTPRNRTDHLIGLAVGVFFGIPFLLYLLFG